MKTNRILSAILSSALVLSMGASAFAVGGSGSGTSTPPSGGGSTTPTTPGGDSTPSTGLDEDGKFNFEYKGETLTNADVIISVTAPNKTSSNIILNPYGLNYLDPETNAVANDDIITGGYNYIENDSNAALAVSWEVTGSQAGNAKLVAKAPTLTTCTTNDVYLPIAIEAVTDKKATPSGAIKTSAAAVLAASTTAQKSVDMPADKTKYGTTYSKPVILDNPNWTYAWGTTGSDTNIKPCLAFGIYTTNAVVNNGAKLATEWTADDTVGVNMVFTFAKAPAWVVEGTT